MQSMERLFNYRKAFGNRNRMIGTAETIQNFWWFFWAALSICFLLIFLFIYLKWIAASSKNISNNKFFVFTYLQMVNRSECLHIGFLVIFGCKMRTWFGSRITYVCCMILVVIQVKTTVNDTKLTFLSRFLKGHRKRYHYKNIKKTKHSNRNKNHFSLQLMKYSQNTKMKIRKNNNYIRCKKVWRKNKTQKE